MVLAKGGAERGFVLHANVVASLLMLLVYFVLGGFGFGGGDRGKITPPIGNEDHLDESELDRLKGNVAGKVIILDPGHGGSNPGAVGVGPVPEKDVVLQIAYNLKAMLEHEGATVVLTRTGDYDPGHGQISQLEARTRLANQVGGDAFVSIHANWHRDSSVRGVETYYYSSGGNRLAQSIQSELVNQSGSISLGVKFGNFYVLRNTAMPAALVEVGFLSNSREAELLAQSWYQEKVARGIYFGLERYFANR